MSRNKVKTISIRPTQEILDALNAYVETHDVSRNGVIMQALEQFLYQYKPRKETR